MHYSRNHGVELLGSWGRLISWGRNLMSDGNCSRLAVSLEAVLFDSCSEILIVIWI